MFEYIISICFHFFDLQYVTFAQLFKGYTTTSFLNAIRYLCPPFWKENPARTVIWNTRTVQHLSMLKVIVGLPLFCSPVPYIERDRESDFKFNATPLWRHTAWLPAVCSTGWNFGPITRKGMVKVARGWRRAYFFWNFAFWVWFSREYTSINLKLRSGHANFVQSPQISNPQILGLIPLSQVRKFLGVQVLKSQFCKFLWCSHLLIANLQIFHHRTSSMKFLFSNVCYTLSAISWQNQQKFGRRLF